MPISLLDQVKQFENDIIAIRRKVHSNPELTYMEFETSKLVASKLKSLGIEVRTNVGGTGVVGLLKGGKKGKVVGLRADMDALPVTENVDLPFKSKNSGVMHACGHDTHVAMLLGAAMLLSKNKKDLSGSVKFLFQPAEEHGGRGGAKPMIEDGAMENPKVDYVFGLHIMNDYPVNTFALAGGAIAASPDSFTITILGKGGHGSEPNKSIDPIFISAHLITALQGIKSRLMDQRRPLVISVCSIHSGSKDNIIPDDAILEGTIRTLDEKVRGQAKRYVSSVSKSICKTFGAKCKIDFMKDAYPVTYNNDKVAEKAFKILKEINGTKTIEMEPMMGGEDFSRFLQKAPGAFYMLGSYNEKKGCIAPNHSSKFKIDEDVLKYGSVSLAKLAMEFGAS
jgi:carboxypeptidase Ss1